MNKSCTIIAHRGESFDAPENTIASINLAWNRGAEAVEIDVQLSLDNEIVVFHDQSTRRLGNKNKLIIKQTLLELKKLDIRSYKGENWAGEKIPTLKEVLQTIPQGKKIVIEIKCNSEILNVLQSDLSSSNLEDDQIEIIGFDFDTIIAAKQMMPQYKVLLLSDLDYHWYGKLFSPSIETLIERCKKNNLDGLDLWAGKKLNKHAVKKIKSSGLLLYVWTVNDISQAAELIEWRVDGITTDRAQWMRKELP